MNASPIDIRSPRGRGRGRAGDGLAAPDDLPSVSSPGKALTTTSSTTSPPYDASADLIANCEQLSLLAGQIRNAALSSAWDQYHRLQFAGNKLALTITQKGASAVPEAAISSLEVLKAWRSCLDAISKQRAAAAAAAKGKRKELGGAAHAIAGSSEHIGLDWKPPAPTAGRNPARPKSDGPVYEVTVSSRANAILEFADPDDLDGSILRYLVSSHVLAETSPYFAGLFARPGAHRPAEDYEDYGEDDPSVLFPDPISHRHSSGREYPLYRIPHPASVTPVPDLAGLRPGGEEYREEEQPQPAPPTAAAAQPPQPQPQTQPQPQPQMQPQPQTHPPSLDIHPLTLILHAAHMHPDRIPHRLPYEIFVGVAAVCMRYRCVGPLELFAEHKWLPQWMHRATDPLPDGVLLISYVFGFGELFARTSKSIILNLADEDELRERVRWPPAVWNRLWQLRCAKMEQVSAVCVSAVREYLRPAVGPGGIQGGGGGGGMERKTDGPAPEADEEQSGGNAWSPRSPPLSSFSPGFDRRATILSQCTAPSEPARLVPTAAPRCPKGSHACDAINLGWLLLVFNELLVLPAVLHPAVVAHPTGLAAPRRSLAQLLDVLRGVSSPPGGVHAGVCDPAAAFRTAINDVSNSVAGLTHCSLKGRRPGRWKRCWAAEAPREEAEGEVGGEENENKAAEQALSVAASPLGDGEQQSATENPDGGERRLELGMRSSSSGVITPRGWDVGRGAVTRSVTATTADLDDSKLLKAEADSLKGRFRDRGGEGESFLDDDDFDAMTPATPHSPSGAVVPTASSLASSVCTPSTSTSASTPPSSTGAATGTAMVSGSPQKKPACPTPLDLEEKSLGVSGEKQLREAYDARLGVVIVERRR